MVDRAKHNSLVQLIQSQTEHQHAQALVTIGEFFDGNDDLGSISCNLSHHPGLDCFRQLLSNIESRDDVEQVWLQIYDWHESDWPFTENVLIVGTIPISEIRELALALQPSEITESQIYWIPSRATNLYRRRYINLWWD
jgi:hypothetical protein